MSEIRKWLESVALDQYADAFEANDIETDLLKQVDDQTLKDIGVASAGHRLIQLIAANKERCRPEHNNRSGGYYCGS